MSTYELGHANGATIDKDGEAWTLVLVRELAHAPAKVWAALTEPAHLREWAPFDADASLATTGAKAKLTTIGAPKPHVTETTVTRAVRDKSLEYAWGGRAMRWELEAMAEGGTRLTLWAVIDRAYISMGATGWHVCFDVLDRLLAGAPLGRICGPDAMKVPGFSRLHEEYASALGVPMPKWG